MVSLPIIVLLLVQSSWGYLEESYLPEAAESSYSYPEEVPENEINLHRRANNNFLRFGRNDNKYDTEYDDYIEDFARPTRSGKIEKNDHFIRFGRGKQDFLRFGRDPHRVVTRDRTNYLRFGRSVVTDEENKKRSKRDTYGEEYKRSGNSNFMRFGRNSNFMRFGRNQENILAQPTASINSNSHHEMTEMLSKMKQMHYSPLLQLLNELIVNMRQDDNKKCSREA